MNVTLGTTSLLGLSYSYCGANGAAGECSSNNGNLLSQIITAPNSSNTPVQMTQNYTYDTVNRVTQAGEAQGSSWTQTYLFDAYGNRALCGNCPYASPQNATPFTSSTTTSAGIYDGANHWLGAGYDPSGNGNLTSVNGQTMIYDSENRLTQVASSSSVVNFTYDGNGRRVTKTATTQSGSGNTIFVYDAMGELAAEYASVATVPPCFTCFVTPDPLGSTRMVTDGNIANPQYCNPPLNCLWRHDDLPFGEEIPTTWGLRSSIPGYAAAYDQGDGVRLEFTGKERDLETGLDYFGARYFSGPRGRFTSPDEFKGGVGGAYEVGGGRSLTPGPLPYADITNPQSLNKYTYALNNPLRYIDPDGHNPADITYQKGVPELNETTKTLLSDAADEAGVKTINISSTQEGFDGDGVHAAGSNHYKPGIAADVNRVDGKRVDSYTTDPEVKKKVDAFQGALDKKKAHENFGPAAIHVDGKTPPWSAKSIEATQKQHQNHVHVDPPKPQPVQKKPEDKE